MMTGSVVSPRPYVGQDAGPQYPVPAGPAPALGPVPPQPRFTPRPPPFPRSGLLPPPALGPRPRFTPHPHAAPRPRFIARPAHPPAGPSPAPVPARRAGLRYERPGRSIIGDELRIPIMWCEFGTCIERYTDVDALGERDLRDRALTAGWCYDLLGRLACPACVQHDETFWVTRPPAPAQAVLALTGRAPAPPARGRQNCPARG